MWFKFYSSKLTPDFIWEKIMEQIRWNLWQLKFAIVHAVALPLKYIQNLPYFSNDLLKNYRNVHQIRYFFLFGDKLFLGISHRTSCAALLFLPMRGIRMSTYGNCDNVLHQHSFSMANHFILTCGFAYARNCDCWTNSDSNSRWQRECEKT